jgi:hypothetical protein
MGFLDTGISLQHLNASPSVDCATRSLDQFMKVFIVGQVNWFYADSFKLLKHLKFRVHIFQSSTKVGQFVPKIDIEMQF